MLKYPPSITRARRAYSEAISAAWSFYQDSMDRERKTYRAAIALAWQTYLQEISSNLTRLEETVATASDRFDAQTGRDRDAENENLSMPLMR